MLMWTAFLSAFLFGSPAHAEQARVISPAMESFPLEQVRLLDGYCLQAQESVHAGLLSFDNDQLLHSFRVAASLPAPGKPMTAMEVPESRLRGMFLGHYLSACAMMYASTGDEKLRDKTARIVTELGKCQDAFTKAGHKGYLNGQPPAEFDRMDAGIAPDDTSWYCPYYHTHKTMAGLYDVYRYCGNKEALRILKNLGEYVDARMQKLTHEQQQKVLEREFGGMGEALVNLYAATKDEKWLKLAKVFEKDKFVKPLMAREDQLAGLHANTHLPGVAALAREYEVTGDKRYETAVDFFWQRVALHRSYATGGSSYNEGWAKPDELAKTLAKTNQENCTNYNMLKVTRHLLEWSGRAGYGDFTERLFFNGILAGEDPSSGTLIYYLPMATGFKKYFGPVQDAYWCCTGTGIESLGKLGQSIYFHSNNALFINLYVSSKVDWKEKGIALEQQTRFPEEETARFTIQTSKPVEAALNFRLPEWAKSGMRITMNGEKIDAKATKGWVTLHRTWKSGDSIEVSMPMSLRAVPLPDDANRVALMVGPIVLAGLASEEKPLIGNLGEIENWIKPVSGKPLHFKTQGQDQEVEFIPLYRVINEEYGIYWLIAPKDSEAFRQYEKTKRDAIEQKRIKAEIKKEQMTRMIDSVDIGNEANEKAHGFQGASSGSGAWKDLRFRHAPAPGWWEWQMAVDPAQSNLLLCTYWGEDDGRVFDILIDGQVLTTEKLHVVCHDDFYDVEYPIPLLQTQGKKKVTVKFVSGKDNIAGGVFGCGILRPKGN